MTVRFTRRGFLRTSFAAASVAALRIGGVAASSDNQDPEYIVVGSGAGGGPLAANLARRGHTVVLIEAGLDDLGDSLDYDVPLLSAAAAPEDPRESWAFYARHYANPTRQLQDVFSVHDQRTNGIPSVYYPRAATLGGCTAHNFLIGLKPHASDWDNIAQITGDASWSSQNMQQYWQRLEANGYGPFMVTGPGHGFNGWLGTQVFDPNFAFVRDPRVVRNIV